MTRRFRPILLLPLLLVLAGCKTDLYSRLSEREANEMLAVLLRAGITAERQVAKDGTSTLRVASGRVADAVDILRANQLPRPSFATMGDVFAQQGLVATPTEERARFIHALSQELSRTISEVDGVLSARIHVVLPRNDPLRQDAAPAAASVFIRHDAATQLGDIVPQLKMLVANSIEGLAYERVSLVLLPVERPVRPPAPAPTPTTAPSGPLPAVIGGLAVGGMAAGAWVLTLRRRGTSSSGTGAG